MAQNTPSKSFTVAMMPSTGLAPEPRRSSEDANGKRLPPREPCSDEPCVRAPFDFYLRRDVVPLTSLQPAMASKKPILCPGPGCVSTL